MKTKKTNINLLKTRLPSDSRQKFLNSIQKHLRDQFETDIGEFEAEELMELFSETLGPFFYNCGIEDTRNYLIQRFAESADDTVILEMRNEK